MFVQWRCLQFSTTVGNSPAEAIFCCCHTTRMFITVFTKFRHNSPPCMFIQCSGHHSNIPSYTVFWVDRHSAVWVATRCRLDWAKVSDPVQTGPRANPASYRTGAGSFAGVKRPGFGVVHPSQSSVEVKERAELYLHFLSVPSGRVLGWTLLFTKSLYC